MSANVTAMNTNVNVELLRQELTWLAEHPERHNQAEWVGHGMTWPEATVIVAFFAMVVLTLFGMPWVGVGVYTVGVAGMVLGARLDRKGRRR